MKCFLVIDDGTLLSAEPNLAVRGTGSQAAKLHQEASTVRSIAALYCSTLIEGRNGESCP